MKFKVTMKTPDVLHDAVNEAVTNFLRSSDLSGEDYDAVHATIAARARQRLERWFAHGEILTVEVDLDAMIARVVERGK